MAIETIQEGSLLKYKTAAGGFDMPPAENVDPELKGYFDRALEFIDIAAGEMKSIRSDDQLSDLGKSKKQGPLVLNAVGTVASTWVYLDEAAKKIDAREAQLLAIPKLDPTYAAMAIEDREIRDWWRSQDMSERAKMIQAFEDSHDHQRIELALLRSPIALIDWEAKAVRDSWNKAKLRENPAEAIAIENGRNSLEWARRGLYNVAELTQRVTGLRGDDLMEVIGNDTNEHRHKGIGVFGFNQEQFERKRLQMKARKSVL